MARKEVSDNFKVFSKRLSALMKERGLRQQALADYLGTKRQTISLYMGGQSMPDAEQLKNIALFFDVSADWLLGLADVRSANIEIQAICARTGLSEAAVSGLMDMKQLSQQKKEKKPGSNYGRSQTLWEWQTATFPENSAKNCPRRRRKRFSPLSSGYPRR